MTNGSPGLTLVSERQWGRMAWWPSALFVSERGATFGRQEFGAWLGCAGGGVWATCKRLGGALPQI